MANVTEPEELHDELQAVSHMVSRTEYGSLAMGVIQVIMLAGLWLLKLRKRSNEAKIDILERKLYKLERKQIIDL